MPHPPRKPELLAPAGNPEKLRIALHYGADAVYLGGPAFGLRRRAGNFTVAELTEAVAYAHRHRAKVYLTVNSYPDNGELPALERYLAEVATLPIDAYIVTDPGVLELVRAIAPERPLHLSTQANTGNWRSVQFWQRQGVSRVNLAREVTLDELRDIRARSDLELEVFVQGALCIAYSGRCLLSSALAGRSANRGDCAHPCRWRYALVEETRPDEPLPVHEEDGGTFIFNSKDLCLLPHLPELLESGVDALKIEGRMKGIHYLATTVRVYREALDRYWDDPEGYRCRPEWLAELGTISHRGYTTGFLFGAPRDIAQEYDARYRQSHDLVGVVEAVEAGGTVVIGVRNRLASGETVEVIGPRMRTVSCRLPEMVDEAGVPLAVAHPNELVRVRLPVAVARFDLLRRVKAVSPPAHADS
jgi:putative protease